LNLIARLSGLNPLLIYLIITAVCLGLVLLFSLATNRWVNNETRRSHNDIAGYILTTVGAIYGVFLAFTTVIVWQNYGAAADNAAREASAALVIYRNLSLYPDQRQAGKVMAGLLVYIHSTVADEFSAMAKAKKSPATEQAMEHLWAEVKKLTPHNLKEQVLFQDILQSQNKLAELRVERLVQAYNPKLSGLMRFALILGAIITTISALLFGAENFWWHVTLTSLLAVLLAAILLVLFEMGHPYASQVGITPDDYREVLHIIEGSRK
jgi:hypothetical protein